MNKRDSAWHHLADAMEYLDSAETDPANEAEHLEHARQQARIALAEIKSAELELVS